MAAELPLVVIVGPTASGKTALAIELAEKYDGEIIAADSRTIYQGADIGTAKPTSEERERVRHWGLDLVTPDEQFSAAQFQSYATDAIRDIRSRGKVPFLVGGSGLYVDAILFDYSFGEVADPTRREFLESLSLEQLHNYCIKNNITLPENAQNKRYVIRAIEQKGVNVKRRKQLIDNVIVVGIATNKDELRERIRRRSEHIFAYGVVQEANRLGKLYGWDAPALSGNVYPLVRQYIENTLTDTDFVEKNATLDWRLAKRQLTWFKRNAFIYWGTPEVICTYIKRSLADIV